MRNVRDRSNRKHALQRSAAFILISRDGSYKPRLGITDIPHNARMATFASIICLNGAIVFQDHFDSLSVILTLACVVLFGLAVKSTIALRLHISENRNVLYRLYQAAVKKGSLDAHDLRQTFADLIDQHNFQQIENGFNQHE